jgi:hypothetical protein
VLLIDSRVEAHPDSLNYVCHQIEKDPSKLVWTSDVVIRTKGNPYAAFWECIVRVAWRKYFKNRTATSFGEEEYDYFPKGTTYFIAPRQELLTACENFESNFDDQSLANDDTVLIKPLTRNHRLNISPEFVCTYNSRDSLKKFVRHSYHRGTVFVDAYVRKGSRYIPFLALASIMSLGMLVLAFIRPGVAASALALGLIAIFSMLKYVGCSTANALRFLYILPIFVPCYGFGILRGFRVLIRSSKSAS